MKIEMMKELAKGLALIVNETTNGTEVIISPRFKITNGDTVRATSIHLDNDFDLIATNMDDAIQFITNNTSRSEIYI